MAYQPSTLNSQLFQQHFDTLAETPEAVAKLRKTILALAVNGRLCNVGEHRQARMISLGDWALGCGFPTAEQDYTDRPILFSKVSDMNLAGNEREILTTNHTIDQATAERLRIKVHPPGTVIFPKIGGAIATNKRRIVVRPTAIDNNCLGIIPNKSCSTEWLFVVLSAIDFTAYQSGTSVPALNQGTIGEIEVSLPPLAEQRRIVAKVEELLALCDELEARQTAAREHRTRLVRSALDHLTTAQAEPEFRQHAAFVLRHSDLVLDSVSDLRQAILQLAVHGRLVPQDLSEKSAIHTLPKQNEKNAFAIVAEDEPFAIPGNWSWVSLKLLGLTQTGTTPPSADPTAFGSDIPFIKPADIYPDRVNYANEGLSFKGVQEYGRLASKGSILMVCIGTIGKSNLITRDCSFNQQINSLTPAPGLDSHLINYFMRSPYFQSEAWARSNSTTLSILNKGNWERIPFPLPPLAEQQRIVAKVDELMRWCDALKARLTAARTTATHLLDATLAKILSAPGNSPTEEPITFLPSDSLQKEIIALWPERQAEVSVEARRGICSAPVTEPYVSRAPDMLRETYNAFWLVGMTKQFRKAIRTIDRNLQGRILVAIYDITENPVTPKGDTVKPLTGDMKEFWRYRIGDFRLVYLPNREKHQVTLWTFAARGGVYD